VASNLKQFSADCITTTFGFEFSVHTPPAYGPKRTTSPSRCMSASGSGADLRENRSTLSHCRETTNEQPAISDC
jgi:hypothetical protein